MVSVGEPSLGPQLMTTVCESRMSGSLIAPVSVVASFSLVGEVTETLGAGRKFLKSRYSPDVPFSPVTRTRYVPVTVGWYWINSLRLLSPLGLPVATKLPDGS